MYKVTPIPAFSDNYIWCLQREGDEQAVVVDPGDGNAVLEALASRGLELAGILITHHHFDHTGGLDTLLAAHSVNVWGPHNLDIPRISQRLGEGDTLSVLGGEWHVLEVPGHTLDHIAFYHDGKDRNSTETSTARQSPILFCGDTLFAGGCGRVFEGTAGMMLASLEKLSGLPADTRVYCAHEYTMANLHFASAVEPDNEALKQRVLDDQAKRDRDQPTVPSTLRVELDTNPFLRCRDTGLAARMAQRESLNASDPVAVFAAVRGWKDNF